MVDWAPTPILAASQLAQSLLYADPMKRTNKKLKLDAQTIRQLDSSKLREAAGGTLNYNYNYNFGYQDPNFGAIRPTVTQVQTGCPSDPGTTSQLGC